MRRTLHAAASVCPARAGPDVIKVVMLWEGGCVARTVVRRLRRGDAAPAACRAVLLALWEARRLRARALVLCTDDAEAADMITGTGAPPEGALGPYLQARALRHTFRTVDVRRQEPVCADLPLWAAAS